MLMGNQSKLGSTHFLGAREGRGNKRWVTEYSSNQKGWVTVFFLLKPEKEGHIILIIRSVGHVFFSKLTKGGPGELECMFLGIPLAHLSPF